MVSRENEIRTILEMEKGSMITEGAKLQKGQYVMTGHIVGAEVLQRRIGFCVQVRLKRGQFRSDMVFLRHPDGNLVTHENQFFWALTDEQLERAILLFSDKAEDEDYEHGYRCAGGVHEKGFLVSDSDSTPAPDTPFSIIITQE